MTILGLETGVSAVLEPSCGDGTVEVSEGNDDEDSVCGELVDEEDVDESDDSVAAVVVEDDDAVDEDEDEDVVESSPESMPPC